MFKKHSFQVKMVKDKDAEEAPTQTLLDSLDLEKIDKTIRDYAMKAAVGFVLIYAAVRTIDTASEIAINISKPR